MRVRAGLTLGEKEKRKRKLNIDWETFSGMGLKAPEIFGTSLGGVPDFCGMTEFNQLSCTISLPTCLTRSSGLHLREIAASGRVPMALKQYLPDE